MPKIKLGWYHCGRCGSLFRSPPGDPADRICIRCGKDPSVGLEPVPVRISVPFSSRARSSRSDGEEEREQPRSKQATLIIRLGTVWVLLLVGVVLLARFLGSAFDHRGDEAQAKPDPQPTEIRPAQDTVLLRETAATCQETLFGYLAAATHEERTQFVAGQQAVIGRMGRFFEQHFLPRIEPETLTAADGGFLSIPGREAVEFRWKGQSNLHLDAVFFKENGDWRLDWDHFVRYQPELWGLFCTEQGEKEAEFRLLVRERIIRDGTSTTDLPLVFAPPRFGLPKETGQPQVRLTILRGSRDGKLLIAALQQRKAGQAPFGAGLAPVDDQDMVRVRAVIRRTDDHDDEGDRKFELVAIKACHWLAVDDPGLTLEDDEPTTETPGEP